MKTKSLLGLELQARFAGLQAWNLWAAQGGMKADPKRGRPLTRIAARAKEIAEHKSLLANLFQKLARLFPLGYSMRWERKGVA
jgi:hypothetical protein